MGKPFGRAWPVLYWLHSVARERNLRAQLADLPALPVPIATGARDYSTAGKYSPAEPVWTATGHGLQLATLAALNVLTVNVETFEL